MIKKANTHYLINYPLDGNYSSNNQVLLKNPSEPFLMGNPVTFSPYKIENSGKYIDNYYPSTYNVYKPNDNYYNNNYVNSIDKGKIEKNNNLYYNNNYVNNIDKGKIERSNNLYYNNALVSPRSYKQKDYLSKDGNLGEERLWELKKENSNLKMELIKKDQILDKLKGKYLVQKSQITELTKLLNELNREKNRGGKKQNMDDSIEEINKAFEDALFFNDDRVQEEMAVAAVEQQIMDELCPNPDSMSYEQLLQLEDKVGHVNKGLTKQRLKQLPLVYYNKNAFKENSSCVICMEDFIERCIVKILPCKHIFHGECIDKWLIRENTCPFCKKEIR